MDDASEAGEKTVILPRPGGRAVGVKPVEPNLGASTAQYESNEQSSTSTAKVVQQRLETLRSPRVADGHALNGHALNNSALNDQSYNVVLNEAATVLALLGKLRQTMSHPHVDRLFKDLVSELSRIEVALKKVNTPVEMVVTCRYVLCSALDEAVIATPWGVESGWAQRSLLSTFHNETSGGEKVFLLLDRLLNSPAQNIDVLELIYLCLNLGFEGKYKLNIRGHQELEALKENLFQRIRAVRNTTEFELSPHWKSDVAKRKTIADYVPLWVVAAFIGALMMLTYSGFRFWLHMDAKPVAQIFQQIVVDE